MKTVLTLAFALFISVFATNAQDAAAWEKEAKDKSDKLAMALDLNEEQHTLVHRQSYELAMNSARLQKMDVSTEERDEMVKAYSKRFNDNMKNILTPEQFEKYKEIRDDKRDKAEQRLKK